MIFNSKKLIFEILETKDEIIHMQYLKKSLINFIYDIVSYHIKLILSNYYKYESSLIFEYVLKIILTGI